MNLKVQSYNHASVQITNIGIFALIANLIFKLLSRKFLFINRKDSRNFLKVGYFFKKIINFKGKIFRILLKHLSDHLSVFLQFA